MGYSTKESVILLDYIYSQIPEDVYLRINCKIYSDVIDLSLKGGIQK